MIAGVDEVGRGPLAGPVIAAAVILNKPIPGIKDSKKMTARNREYLAEQIKEHAIAFAYGRAEVEEIDRLNIHHATLLAMKRALEALPICPSEAWIDGLFVPEMNLKCKAILQGDSSVYQISAASILAKVVRDLELIALDALYPGYGFAKHKGYGTKAHQEALRNLGPCAIHRKSFRLTSVTDSNNKCNHHFS